jgi:dephospho-CoA kinase
MLKVGITGGIGSGKSTIAKVFEVLGIPVYYADDRAKFLMNNNEDLRQQLVKNFGENTFTNDQLNRPYLSSKVFNNTAKLELLNSIVHPITIADAENWMQQQTSSYCIKEAALIFESGAQQNLDYVIGVTASTALRIQRVMHRDGIDRETIIARMDKQISDTIKMRLCDFVIDNNEQKLVIPQVIKIHKSLLALV